MQTYPEAKMASGFGKPIGYQMLAANNLQSPTLLLKDYLRDNLSSCSSSGFKSIPRRQCCLQPHFSSSSTKSALQKASESLLNAIKSLPIPARQRSPSLSRTQRCKAKKGGVLSRSFSRRLLSRSFWRRASSSKGDEPTFPGTVSSASNNNIKKWTESHYTCSLTTAKDFTEMEGSVTPTNTFSTTNSTREWSNEEKEQFSPVSVLDCPLFHEEEEITSPFNSTTCCRVEATNKHKHMQKGQHFTGVASLKPVALEKRMSWSVMQEDEPIYNHPTKPCRVLVPITCTQYGNSDLLCDNVEDNVKIRPIPSNCLRTEAENLMFDFFKQNIIGDNNNYIENSMKRQYLCKVEEDWIRGQQNKQYLSWQVGEGRQVYIREMGKYRGSWRICDEEIQHLAMELEVDFSTSLVEELVLDLTT